MTDRISITRLAVYARHGVLPEEERLGQRFLISVSCEAELKAAGATDDFRQTTSYADIANLAASVATDRRFRTLEGLAKSIAAELLAAFPRLAACQVKVEKPGAPINHMFESVAVEIERRRDG